MLGGLKEKYHEYKNKIKDIVSKGTSWDFLRKVQTNKLVKSTYIWLVLVPTLSKLFSSIEDYSFFLTGIELSLGIPFNWLVFYFSALLFVLGNILFYVYAPDIIKEYEDYGDYISTGRHIDYLKYYMNDELKKNEEEYQSFMQKMARGRHVETDLEKEKQRLFWFVYDYYKKYNSSKRKICAIVYLWAFILFSFVSVQSVAWVVLHSK